MLCQNCKTQLPDDASFCLKCGRPQKSITQSSDTKYEFCEIDAEMTERSWLFYALYTLIPFIEYKRDYIFVATAIGPQGRKILYYSKKFSRGYLPADKKTLAHLEPVINQLLKDGWEVTETRGREWYQYRFRRYVQ